MKVLFLISSPGKGHAHCAEAVQAARRRDGREVETDILDIHNIIDKRVSEAIQDGYLRMTAEQPALYQRLYDLDRDLYRQLSGEIPADRDISDFLAEQQRRWFPEMAAGSWFNRPCNLDTALINTLVNGVRESRRHPTSRLLMKGLLQLIYRILAKRLKEAVQIRQPDVLVATQMYPNALLTQALANGSLHQPMIGVITDYGVHGVWVRPTTDHYCVAHPSTARMLVERGVNPERIRVTGIPLMPAFSDPLPQAEARRQLGLDQRLTVLITGGQHSIGIVDAVRWILEEADGHVEVMVTARPRTPGYANLRELTRRHPQRLHLHDWTDRMDLLMRAADLVVGKPGGLTVSESLACGRPFIATCCLGGQEAHNVRFLEEHGVGRQMDPVELPGLLRRLLTNPEQLQVWQQRASAQGRRDGARQVADLVVASLGDEALTTADNDDVIIT